MPFTIRLSAIFAAFLLVLIGCGDGGSSQGPSGVGGLTILVGDGPLDDVDAVLLDIEEVILLGSGGQREVLIQGGLEEPIDLLRLRNLTERIFDGDVPAGDYNKIRMIINSIQIVEDAELDLVGMSAQLPAGGKIDLNPQGPFEIVAGEDLVIEIDFELDRAVHVVFTGNSKYKFRPVVFVDVIDQAENARLTHIYGRVDRPGENGVPFVICEVLDGGDEECSDILPNDTQYFDQDGGRPLPEGEPMDTDMVHAFGNYYVEGEADPGTNNLLRFRPILIIKGAEEAITSIEGEVIEPSEGLIPLDTVDDEANASDTNVTTAEGTLVLNKIGIPMVPATGQEAEAWGFSSQIASPEFPAFLVILSEDDAEETAEGLLRSVDGDIIVLEDEAGVEVCVTYQGAEDTKIFQITERVDGSEGTPIGIADLLALVGTVPTPEVSVFGDIVDGCVIADSVIVEIDD
jgi:hypothetical protein